MMRRQIPWLWRGPPDRRSVVKDGASTHLHRYESLLVVNSHERGLVSEDVLAKCDKGWCGAGGREHIS